MVNTFVTKKMRNNLKMNIQYPITVDKIVFDNSKQTYDPNGWRNNEVGKFVAIRPVNKEDSDKTYLGIYLGEFAVSIGASYDKDTKELKISRFMYNPAIFVFDLNKVLFGYESWWCIIKSEKDLQQITDKDIENVWYVKALKQLQETRDKNKLE